jgi:hypothetical protein
VAVAIFEDHIEAGAHEKDGGPDDGNRQARPLEVEA